MNKQYVALSVLGFVLAVSPVTAAASKMNVRTTKSECGSKGDCDQKVEEELNKCPANYLRSATKFVDGTATVECLPIAPVLPAPVRGDSGKSALVINSTSYQGNPYWVISGCPSGMPTPNMPNVRSDNWTVFQAVCLAPGYRIEKGMIIPADKAVRSWPVHHNVIGCFALDTSNGQSPTSWASNARGEQSDTDHYLTFNAEVKPAACSPAKPAAKRSSASRPVKKFFKKFTSRAKR